MSARENVENPSGFCKRSQVKPQEIIERDINKHKKCLRSNLEVGLAGLYHNFILSRIDIGILGVYYFSSAIEKDF